MQVGDEFRVLVDEEKRIVLVREVDPITRFAGSLTYPPGYLEALRNEWERDQPAADLEDSEADDAVST